MNNELFDKYINILREELVPAMGCTEPIALAYGAACSRDLLGTLPEQVEVIVSGNLVKNAKSVTVPNTDGLRGIEASVAAGLVAGRSEAQLEVIAHVNNDDRAAIREYLHRGNISVSLSDSDLAFDYTIRVTSGADEAELRIANAHTNIVYRRRNGQIIDDTPVNSESCDGMSDHGCLTVEDIVRFADEADITPIIPPLERQIDYNCAICDEGLENQWGACIGRTIDRFGADDVITRAKSRTAAGSDARMNGCAMPVVIISGSGNQGITACVPVVCYAEKLGSNRDELLRALALSDLVAIHLKTGIGRLSAFCGAVCAGVGAGAGICRLEGGGFKEIAHTIVNALAISSGIICDGAKASCAAKIALSVEAGIMGWNMYKCDNQFLSGDGIIAKGVENTIRNIGTLGHDGMKYTDRKILEIMTGCS